MRTILDFIRPFLHPAAGYFDTLPRLAALFAQVLPFHLAPLAFNCMAIVIQVLPAQFLMSSRCREMGSTMARCLFAFLYLALPNSQELHANITNAQWRFALLAILIFFAQPARTALWNAFDLSVVALSGLSGPFIIFLAPIAAILHRSEPRNRWRFSLFADCGFHRDGASDSFARLRRVGAADERRKSGDSGVVDSDPGQAGFPGSARWKERAIRIFL